MRKNNNVNENDILQNKFTAYLLTAVKRQKNHYLRKQNKRRTVEIVDDEIWETDIFIPEETFYNALSIMEQIENQILYYLLKKSSQRDIYIFLTRILEERSFADLSEELDISYKAVSNAYYRFLRKIRDRMKGDGEN